ncbi:hypothetical protein EW146_g365 [Bondarzewia mesenterica]|uniref:Lysine-specific metallo-endopeptidase domain-containing protein n=1 Tax=Bondarzewia mesenterica TaxID=1095465 RepID=A0A4S4M787_9AGAM|nr:hypothetical protein EW146_g365 [Bondarzewia mesenterica]
MRVVLASLLLSALGASAAPGLSLSVSTPDTVVDVDNLKVTTILKNTGDESIKVFAQESESVISTYQTNSFAISSESGAVPSFTGVKVKYVAEKVVAANKESSFAVLAPGETIEVEHDLAGVYNFTSVGVGKYGFDANNRFFYVDAENQLQAIEAETTATASKVTGKLAAVGKRPARRSVERRAIGYNGCSSSRESSISTAASNAVTYVNNATSYLSGISSGTARYTTWFGSYTSSRKSTVQTHYAEIGSDPLSTTYDCTCTDSDAYAYVYPDEHGYIYLCGAFWDAPATGTDSKAGTIVHEQSHFTDNGSTQDYVYGQSGCKSLASSNPSEAIENADSHEYFAENNPSLS